MAKMRKRVHENEDKCKKLHQNMNMHVGPTKLEPRLFMIMDTDNLQKQVNCMENRVNHMERIQARKKWRGKNSGK